MSIKSIKIKNLLSFDELNISKMEDINCIVGKNNVGKSNLLKLIKYFYNKLDGKRELPPTLNSKYNSFGTITIVYDITRIKNIVQSKTNKEKSKFFKYIYNTLFKEDEEKKFLLDLDDFAKESSFELTLQINSDDSTKWLNANKDILNVINYLYPFFDIETRHLNLYDWNKLWLIVSRLKSFNVNNINEEDIKKFFNENISLESNAYEDYVNSIEKITKANQYSYREKVLNYVKVGLKGQTFLIDDQSLETQSDGTNSHKFIEIALELLLSLSRREYISPTIYIDEPELGLHPKRNEELIYKLFDIYNSFKKIKSTKEKGKYKTPYPRIIFATHSPSIVKEVIKLFDKNQQILHFSKNSKDNTLVKKMNSTYDEPRFLNIFSDNEARLFFSNFILFVEGETELEIFLNKKLLEKFPKLKEIDVYKSSSNVLGAYINPSYANTAIPYIFLFDADKIYSFKVKQDNIVSMQLENKNKKLYILPDGKHKEYDMIFNNLILKYQKGFNLKYKNETQNLLGIKRIDSLDFTFNHFSFMINERKEYRKYINYLKNYLESRNVNFLHTTIEEVLINKNAKNLFFSWLECKKDIDIESFLYDIREITYSVSIYKQRVDIGKVHILKPRRVFIKKTRYKREKFTKEVEKYLIDYLRIKYFNGKFELLNNKILDNTFANTSTFKKGQINEFDKMKKSIYKKLKSFGIKSDNKKKQIEDIFNRYIEVKNLSNDLKYNIDDAVNKFPISSFSKTSWTTNFLNYAIDEIEKTIQVDDSKNRKKEFREVFKQNFRELYDIIIYIEKKL